MVNRIAVELDKSKRYTSVVRDRDPVSRGAKVGELFMANTIPQETMGAKQRIHLGLHTDVVVSCIIIVEDVKGLKKMAARVENIMMIPRG